ncbi:protein eva-1 homolog B isoform X2 [Pleurodeles waltl]|uniref:protein eva-1 homolog B isoform X2 n=1 Tax=Pleurodeles waltl TaxID=8319 RepID=UPI0037099D2E
MRTDAWCADGCARSPPLAPPLPLAPPPHRGRSNRVWETCGAAGAVPDPCLVQRFWLYSKTRQDNPESFGLYFVLGVCFGLVLTLCLLVIRISCQPRTHTLPAKPRKSLKDYSKEEECAGMQPHEEEEESDNNDEAEPLNLTTDIPLVDHSPSNDGTLTINVFTSAEELERAQRLEERERIIREIWRNGQPDILGTGTGTIGRVHYY